MPDSPAWALRGEEARFYEYCNERRLVMQRCDDCGEYMFPPRPICPNCWGSTLTWSDLSGRATVETFSIEMRPSPGLDLEAPYVVAMVRTEEGPAMLTNIDADPEEVTIDMEVEVDFREFLDGLVPIFRPITS